jgi:hypothetical protein
MSLAVIAVTVAQLLDLGTFIRMVAVHGPASEANPLVGSLLVVYGLPLVAVAKIAALSLVVAVVVVLSGSGDARRSPRLAAAITAIAIGAGLLGGWTNAATLL